MKAIGWFLDVHIDGENAVLWFKLESGQTLRLIDRYKPDFYIQLKKNDQLEELISILNEHPNILGVTEKNKFTSVNAEEKAPVLHVYVDRAQNVPKVLRDVKKLRLIEAYYNTDILHVQRYLFQRNFAPTNKVELEYNEKSRLVKLRIIEDYMKVKPPPFTALIFDVEIESQTHSPNVNKDPISKIILFNANLSQKIKFDGNEEEVLRRFFDYIRKEDPDFLVSSQVATVLKYIIERARLLELNLQLGREKVIISQLQKLIPYAHRGRVLLNLHTFLEIGITGIVERSRFTLAPPALSAKWSAGRTIDSRQCFEALRENILPPQTRGNFKYVTTAKDVIFRDRGGFILSPKVGLHENVAELDYESMYPQIIINHNISYETVTPYFIHKYKKGFLGELTRKFLERRLYFKHLKKRYNKNSREWLWCEQHQLALKGILVSIYGYSGCFANRFNNVTAYEEINKIARDILVKTMNLAMQEGFEVIYADSDSLFVKKKDANQQDYEKLAETIHKKMGLLITLDHYYKFLVFLSQKADPNMKATRRYFGKLMNGNIHYRGIELRRHDCPFFFKQLQEKLLDILFDAECIAIVEGKQFNKAYNYVVETCNKIFKREIKLEKLTISKFLRKPVNEYTSMLPHVVAAIQTIQSGKNLRNGEKIDFVFVNANHTNPFRRVVAASLSGKLNYYDREKYVEMTLDVAETILSVFGFDRKYIVCNKKSKILQKIV